MVREALETLSITDGVLTILLVGEKKIKNLNKEFFQKNLPTNVISFSYDDEIAQGLHGAGAKRLEGDILISLNTVLSEVEGEYLSVEEKIFFYIVHGITHMLGFGHEDEAGDGGQMRKVETDIFFKVTGKEVE